MIFQLRLLTISLDAFAIASLVGSLAALWIARWPLPAAAFARANALFLRRMLPLTLGVGAAVLTLASNALWENRDSSEHVGLTLQLLAAASALIIGGSLVQAVIRWRSTRRLVNEWMRQAEPIDLPAIGIPAYRVPSAYPVVALVGMVRPKLFIADAVMRACPPDEIAAILAHERSHLRRRDNLRRVLLASSPDLLSFMSAGRGLVAAWYTTSEQAADDAARPLGPYGPVCLAQALVRVARLAMQAPLPPPLPASAFYRGGSIETRVRRLVNPMQPGQPREPWPVLPILAGLGASAVAIGTVQTLIEFLVRTLP
jgi:Zn-dependent protease with chaperone function